MSQYLNAIASLIAYGMVLASVFLAGMIYGYGLRRKEEQHDQ